MNKSTFLFVLAILTATIRGGEVFGPAFRVPEVAAKATALAIDGPLLYCGSDDSLYVLDISSPLKPKLLTRIDGFGYLRQIQTENGWVVVSARGGGAWIVDARTPAQAKVASHFDTVEQATGIEIAGDLMFVGLRQMGVEIVDITDRAHPEHVRMVKTPESQTCRYESGWLYSGDWHSGEVNALDVRDLSRARIVGRTEMHGLGDGFDLEGPYIYASTGHHRLRGANPDLRHPDNWGHGHGLEIWDRTVPEKPTFVSRVDFPVYWSIGNDMWTCRVANGWAFCADTYNGLFAVDVHDPKQPRIADRFVDPDPNPKDPKAPSRCISYVAVGDGAVYVASLGGGLVILPCPAAHFRPQNRSPRPGDATWRDPYPTESTRFTAWQPPRRGAVHSVAAAKGFYYVGASHAGAYVVDAASFKTIGEVPCAFARDVQTCGDKLYVAEGDDGLGIYSLADPVHPREIRRIRTFSQGVARCEWVYVPTERWAICHSRQDQVWRFMDLSRTTPVATAWVHGLPWVRPFADGVLAGNCLGYAHTHDFFTWFDLAGERPTAQSTQDTVLSGPINRQPNFLKSHAGCTPIGTDRILVCNNDTFILLKANQRMNADKTPWPTFGYANTQIKPAGLPTWDGHSLVALVSNNQRAVQLADFTEPTRPKFLWRETVVGALENAVFADGALLVPCGYQGLLKHTPPQR